MVTDVLYICVPPTYVGYSISPEKSKMRVWSPRARAVLHGNEILLFFFLTMFVFLTIHNVFNLLFVSVSLRSHCAAYARQRVDRSCHSYLPITSHNIWGRAPNNKLIK